MKKLSDINTNETYIVQDIVNIDKIRLLELGFTKGVRIKKVYESMDKNMIGIKVKGSTIGIRSSVCENIYVREVVK